MVIDVNCNLRKLNLKVRKIYCSRILLAIRLDESLATVSWLKRRCPF